MIHSSVEDNWLRVALMHGIARDIYASTQGTEFRERITSGGEIFPFDVSMFDSMESESRIVGMVMAWSVVTLESLVNHQLAATLNNKVLATMAIEYPSQVTDKLKLSKSARSELAKKLIILMDGTEQTAELSGKQLVDLADKLADTRNRIVHDKPFSLIDNGDGDVEIQWFRSREGSQHEPIRYGDLPDFYTDCDTIKDCILKTKDFDALTACKIEFGSLISG